MCYSWEMELDFSLDVLFDNIQDWKVVMKKAGVIRRREAYIKMVILPVRFSVGVTLILLSNTKICQRSISQYCCPYLCALARENLVAQSSTVCIFSFSSLTDVLLEGYCLLGWGPMQSGRSTLPFLPHYEVTHPEM